MRAVKHAPYHGKLRLILFIFLFQLAVLITAAICMSVY